VLTSAPMTLRKRSLSLAGHATSVALEPEFWAVLEQLARSRGLSLPALVGQLDQSRGPRPLASACRVAALEFALGPEASDRLTEGRQRPS
jgi:predicted DNA-binding ribbon-helix-helix protein